MPSDLQRKFIRTFTEELFREIQFMVDVSRERATRRKTFFERLTGKVDDVFKKISMFSGFFPIIKEGVATLQKVSGYALKGFKFIFERNNGANIGAILSETNKPELLLKVFLEEAARRLARRHEFFITHLCTPEGIEPFAIVGVARVLQYLSDTKNVEFSVETLLRGAIQGRSGSGQQKFKNNKININHPTRKSVDAETIYGRSAHMDLQGIRYFDREAPAITYRKTYGYVDKEEGLPLGGVIVMHPEELEEYGFEEQPLTPALSAHLKHYVPKFLYIDRAALETYMTHVRELGGSEKPPSLSAYYEVDEVLCRGDLTAMNLARGNFTGVDFLDCDFTKAILNDAIFEQAYMVGATLVGASAHRVNFRHANLSLVNAENADFSYSDFTGAQMFYASLQRARLISAHYMGADCYGSNFAEIEIEEIKRLELLELETTTQALLTQQDLQHTLIQQLGDTQTAHSSQLQLLAEHYEALKMTQRESNFAIRLVNSRLLELEESLEDPVDAADFAILQEQSARLEQAVNQYHQQVTDLDNEFQLLTTELGKIHRTLSDQSTTQSVLQEKIQILEILGQRHTVLIQGLQELADSTILTRRVSHLEEVVASNAHLTTQKFGEQDRKFKMLEQKITVTIVPCVFGRASSSRAPAPQYSDIAISPELQRVCEILTQYPLFPGYPFCIKAPTQRHPRPTLRYKVPNQEKYRLLVGKLKTTKALIFNLKLQKVKDNRYLEFVLESYDMQKLEEIKEEKLPRYLEKMKEWQEGQSLAQSSAAHKAPK